MKKALTIILTLVFVGIAFAGINDFNNAFGSITFANLDRFQVYDESGEISSDTKTGYVTWATIRTNLDAEYSHNGTVIIDTNTIVDDASIGAQSLSASLGDLVHFIGIYAGGNWDSTDYVIINDADSNATAIDSLTLVNAGFYEKNLFVYCDKDTTFYFNFGDSVSVSSDVEAPLFYEIIEK